MKADQWLPLDEGGGEDAWEEGLRKWLEESFGGDRYILDLACDGFTVYKCVNTY